MPVHRFAHIAARLLGVMLILTAAAMPAAAADRHVTSHLRSTVDQTAHHHHDADGAVVAGHHHGDQGEAPSDDEPDGHAHMPVQVLVFDAPLPPATAGAVPAITVVKSVIGQEQPPPDIRAAPPNRPPRSA